MTSKLTSSLHRGFQLGFVCPFCFSPHHNPGADDGKLSEPERRLLKEKGALPRICLTCGSVYTLVARLCTVPGTPHCIEFDDDYHPRNEKNERMMKRLPISKKRALSSWVAHIRPMLKEMHEDGWTVPEIASKLNKPEKRVRRWMQRAGILKGKWAK